MAYTSRTPPSPAQARTLKALADNPAVRITWTGSNADWTGPQSWKVREQLGTLRSPTVRVLAQSGWIEVDPDDRWETDYRLSDTGREAIADLGAEDMRSPTPEISAEDVRRALRSHFDPQEWWLIEEVAIGEWGRRYIDALALRLIRGRSYDQTSYTAVWAIEIKVSRPDFLKEIKDPTKRRPAEALANVFVFAAPLGMIDPDELPDGCGLLEIDNRGKVQVTARGEWTRKDPPDWRLVAAMARADRRITADTD